MNIRTKMEVFYPKLMWVNERCYRVSDIEQKYVKEHANFDDDVLNSSVMAHSPTSCYVDEVCESEFDIEITENGQYSTSFEIPNAIRGILIGAKGVTKKKIENETKTSIRFPMQGYEGNIIIKGSSQDAVAVARRRMESLAASARHRHEPTHFLSLPLNDPKIMKSFGQFKENILANCEKGRGITPLVFQRAEKLHLTIGTLVLLSPSEREAASIILNNCAEKIVKPLLRGKPLHVKMKGIEVMNDDPAEVDVLYAKVFSEKGQVRALQNLADNLMKEFVNAGLMSTEYESIKLHATVLNSIFSRSQPKGSPPNRRDSFDARMIIKEFSNFDFGTCIITGIHLSQRHTKGKDGYYSPTSVVPLPT